LIALGLTVVFLPGKQVEERIFIYTAHIYCAVCQKLQGVLEEEIHRYFADEEMKHH